MVLSRGVAARWSRMAGQRGHPGTPAHARHARHASSRAAGWPPAPVGAPRPSPFCHAGAPRSQAGPLGRSVLVQYPRNCMTICSSGSLGVRRERRRRPPGGDANELDARGMRALREIENIVFRTHVVLESFTGTARRARQDRISDRLECATPVGSFGAVGLGLFIARRFVEAHGGTGRMPSAVGECATLTVELPAGGRRGQGRRFYTGFPSSSHVEKPGASG